MKKYRILAVVVLCLVGVLGIAFVTTPSQAAKKRISREEMIAQRVVESFEKGERAYQERKYAEARSYFLNVQKLEPTYRANEVDAYLKLIECKLRGTPRKVEKFEQRDVPEKEVKLKQEEKWQALIAESEEAILSAGKLLDSVRKTKKIHEKDLLDIRLNFSGAEVAFEKKQYKEATRLANKCKYEIEVLLSRREPPKKLLGKIGNTPVTLNLDNADLQQTLKLIYDLTGANIVLSPGIKGKVTINVKDLPLRDVLNVIVETNNLKYIEKENIIRIMSQAEYEKSEEGLTKINQKVFPLHYAEANSIAKIIKDTLKIESVIADPRTNSIIVDVTSTAEADKIENLIRSLDTPVSQVLIDVKLVEVALSKGTPESPNTLGIDWEAASQIISGLEPTTTLTGPVFGEVAGVLPTGPNLFAFAISNKRMTSVIKALAQQGNVHMLSQPRILTLDGKQAMIDVVEEVPFVTGVTATTTTSGGTTTTSYSYTIETRDDVGITLLVLPRIQRDRSVQLHLEIEQIRIIDYLELPISSQTTTTSKTPHTADRITTQDVVVWDGQTLILGGMIGTRKGKMVHRVPILGRIPILGALFRKTSTYDERTELVIFLTPHVITSFDEGKRLTDEKRPLIQKKPGLGMMEEF